jgi:hypothetical protein
MDADHRLELERTRSTPATREDIRAEFERLREDMTMLIERHGRKIQGLIDAIELMKYIDSQPR